MNRELYDSTGTLIRSEVADIDAGTVTITEGDKVSMAAIPPADLARLRAEAREQRQLERLDANFTALRDGTRLTPATYRQATAPADLRPLVQEINALRAMVLDLTRLVRGMAAEDQ